MRKIIKALFTIVTVLAVLIYLPSCLVYVISPATWWPMGILGIGFPYTWAFLLALVICWVLLHKKTAAALFVLLLAGLPIIKNVVTLRGRPDFETKKAANCLRVLQWNCQGFVGSFFTFPDQVAERYKAVQFLKQYQPDVLCLAEFTEVKGDWIWSNINLLQDSLGYRYFAFYPYYKEDYPWAKILTGNAIFSKYPITNSSSNPYPNKRVPEDILSASIDFNGKKLRFLNTHLASMHLNHIRVPGPMQPYLAQDSSVIFHGSMINKLKYFQRYHVNQAAFLKAIIDTSKGPLIVGGDFNSVPSSYVYRQVRGNLSDVFLEKGSGLGRSFHSNQPALRIDYLFHSSGIEVLQWNIFRISFSDHDPQIADIMLR